MADQENRNEPPEQNIEAEIASPDAGVKPFDADDVSADDPHKAEKLAKAGRVDNPQEASE